MTLIQYIGITIVILVLAVGLLSPAYFEWKIGKLLDELDKT